MPKLTEVQWDAIRQHYELDPDEPVYATAGARAAERLGFIPPTKQAIHNRKQRDGWMRRGSLASVNSAAHRRADALVSADGVRLTATPGAAPTPDRPASGLEPAAAEETPPAPAADAVADATDDVSLDVPPHGPRTDAQHALLTRLEAEDKRAEVIARHRTEWRQVAVLRQEAMHLRKTDFGKAMDRLRLAKVTAETTAIQQTGERKAWGLDDIQIPDLTKKSDAELKAIVEGKGA